MSDLYEIFSDTLQLELQVLVLNINDGYTEELKAQCKALREYMIYIDKVRCSNKFFCNYKKARKKG